MALYGMAGIDTAAVLFFLALEYGRGMRVLSMDAILMAVTMAMVISLPYFLPSSHEKPTFGNWFARRGALMMIGILLGAALPSSARFLPMILLIAASAVSCYIQFYGLMRLHLAK
jgi:hypothetical protein